MKYFIAVMTVFLSITAVFSVGLPQNMNITGDQLEGKWVSDAGIRTGSVLIFKSNKFYLEVNSCTMYGSFLLSNNKITLRPTKFHHVSLHMYNFDLSTVGRRKSFIPIENYKITCSINSENNGLVLGPEYYWIIHMMNSVTTVSRISKEGIAEIVKLQKYLFERRKLKNNFIYQKL